MNDFKMRISAFMEEHQTIICVLIIMIGLIICCCIIGSAIENGLTGMGRELGSGIWSELKDMPFKIKP